MSSNRWWEITIDASTAAEESIFWRLTDFGCKGTATSLLPEGICRMKAYVPELYFDVSTLAGLHESIVTDLQAIGLPEPAVSWISIAEEDWSQGWKSNWHPQEIGNKLLICPAWIDPPQTDRQIIKLDPGVAFGTGTHATTQLCLEALEMRLMVGKNQTIADLGCGSGILSTAAILLGASTVYAVDNDPLATNATEENRDLNDIDADRLLVGEGSIDWLEIMIPEPVDGMVCNILAETIIELAPKMDRIVKPNGWGILSGVLMTQVPQVSRTMESLGWQVGLVWRRESWSCIHMRRNS
jgi:ribosomal protein L11 methyltransferase